MTVALAVALAQTAVAWFMAGLIWTMQVLNYPLLARVGADHVPAYEQAHNRRFGLLVVPGVVLAAGTTVALFLTAVPVAFPVAAAVLLAVVVVATARYGAPSHTALARGWDPAVHARLVAGNWIRTVAWTLLGVLDLALLATVAGR